MKTRTRMNGPDLKVARRKFGITQTEMGARVGICRHSVSYWERRSRPFTAKQVQHGALPRMLDVLGITFEIAPRRARNAIFSDTRKDELANKVLVDHRGKPLPGYMQTPWFREALERMAEREREKDAQRRVICGAKTRKGHPCPNKSEPGGKRCKFHGGKSTGPKTQEGKARIAEAQRHRWAEYRASKSP